VGDGAGYRVQAVSDSERSAVRGRGATGPPNQTLGTLVKPTVAAGSDPRRSLYSTKWPVMPHTCRSQFPLGSAELEAVIR
jgi:hypothetical protein